VSIRTLLRENTFLSREWKNSKLGRDIKQTKKKGVNCKEIVKK
jgi:hypothetical protein